MYNSLRRLELRSVASDGVLRATGLVQRGLVAISSGPPPTSVDEVLVVFDGHRVRPHAVRKARPFAFAVAAAAALVAGKILYDGGRHFDDGLRRRRN